MILGMKHFQARRGGRFIRNTAENTFGLHFGVHGRKADGSWCGAFNRSTAGQPKPERCHACGESLVVDSHSQEA